MALHRPITVRYSASSLFS